MALPNYEKLNPTSWTNASLQSVLSGGTVRYTKIGNLVILTIRNLITSSILTGGTTLVKGLPKPVIVEQFLISNVTTTNADINCLVGINTSGDLSIVSDTMYASGAQYFAQFAYLTNE